MTLALSLAAAKQDPRMYNDRIDIFRGICEGIFFILTMCTLFIEVYQFKK